MSNDLTTNRDFDAYARQFGWLYDNSGNYQGQIWNWYIGNEPGLVLLRQSPDLVAVVHFHGLTPTQLWSSRIATTADFDRMMAGLLHQMSIPSKAAVQFDHSD